MFCVHQQEESRFFLGLNSSEFYIQLKPSAKKDFISLSPSIQRELSKAIDDLAYDPFPEGCKPVESRPGLYHLAIQAYCVLYYIDFHTRKIILVRMVKLINLGLTQSNLQKTN